MICFQIDILPNCSPFTPVISYIIAWGFQVEKSTMKYTLDQGTME
jgi:hypothetical protein